MGYFSKRRVRIKENEKKMMTVGMENIINPTVSPL